MPLNNNYSNSISSNSDRKTKKNYTTKTLLSSAIEFNKNTAEVLENQKEIYTKLDAIELEYKEILLTAIQNTIVPSTESTKETGNKIFSLLHNFISDPKKEAEKNSKEKAKALDEAITNNLKFIHLENYSLEDKIELAKILAKEHSNSEAKGNSRS